MGLFPNVSPKTILHLTCSKGRTVVNVGGLAKWAVGPTYIMVVSANDDWSLTVDVVQKKTQYTEEILNEIAKAINKTFTV